MLVINGDRKLVGLLDRELKVLIPLVGSRRVRFGAEVALNLEHNGRLVGDLAGLLGQEGMLKLFGFLHRDLESTREWLPEIALSIANGIGWGGWICERNEGTNIWKDGAYRLRLPRRPLQ